MWTKALSKSSSPVDRAWITRAMSLCCRPKYTTRPPQEALSPEKAWRLGGFSRSTMSVWIVSIFLPPRTWRHNASYWLEGSTSDHKPIKEHPSKPSIPWKGLYLSSCSRDSPNALSFISISIPMLVIDTRLASVVGAWAGVCATDRPRLKWKYSCNVSFIF